jgi:archaemetzincin
MRVARLLACLAILYLTGCGSHPATSPTGAPSIPASDLKAQMKAIAPLFSPLEKPRAGDWLASHKENGQTFQEWLDSNPVTATGKRRKLYILPVGDFTKTQRKIVTLASDFMQRYFGLPVKVLDDFPQSAIPPEAQRVHPSWGVKQILSTYIMESVLAPRLPDDATAMIAFTAVDLWPGAGWNFVFGQASLQERVGVWSINRNGDPDASEAAFQLCLLRTLKTATHETGHMLSIHHCIAYNCNMCGCNNLAEADRHTIALCPECLPKLCTATGLKPADHFKALIDFFREHKLSDELTLYEKLLSKVESVTPAP